MTTLTTTQISSLTKQLSSVLDSTIGTTVREALANRPQMQKAMPQAKALSLSAIRPTRTKAQLLDSLNVEAESLRSRPWSDEQIAQLPDEGLAALAFDMSQPLRREFGTREVFMAYWRSRRR